MPWAKPLIDTPADTLRELQTKTHCHPLWHVKMEEISITLGEVYASKVVHSLAHAIARVRLPGAKV